MRNNSGNLGHRILALFLCMAMICSYIVLPAGAESVDAVPTEKCSVRVDNINAYESGEAVITHQNWLSYQAANGNASLKNFLINEADQYVDLMPSEGKTFWSDSVKETCAMAKYNDDGTVSIVNYYSQPNFNWPYVYTTPAVSIDLEQTRWLYFTYEGTNWFNVVIDYSYGGNFYSKKPQTSDYPAMATATTHCVDLHAVTGLSSGTIVLNEIKFYTVGSWEGYVKLHNFGVTSSETAAQTYADGGTGTYMDGYTVLMVEYMGTRKDNLSGVDGVEFFVDAVIDGGVDFDEEPHQLKAKTDYGFMLYIPDAVMESLPKKPARGDLVDTTFLCSGLSGYSSGSTTAGHTLTFYENPTNTLSYATAESVNATVKLFNYDGNVSRDDFNFWNGFWGWGASVEALDGPGVENGKYQYPVPMNTLSSAGYPQLNDGNNGAYALDYLFDGTQSNADGSSYLVSTMSNGGGLFQLDEDGYYYYDSMQNAAYYDEGADKFVLMDDLIVRPWYNSNTGDDYKDRDIFTDYADVGGAATAYGNFLPFNKIDENNITIDGAVYYNASATGRQDGSGNWIYTDIHTADEAYTAYRKAVGSLERYGLNNTAADKVIAGNKAMFYKAYNDIVQANGGDVMSARIEDKLDMGFGMTVDFDFYQPQDGKFHGEDMEFDFLGDDDVFVYVGVWTGTEYEYRLVLDIGGIHEAKNGNINFATSAVADWPAGNTTARTGRSLYQIFMDADGDGVVSETEAQGEFAQYFDGEVFADFTKLSLKFFYLERGGNISYCRLRFNMPTLPENSLTISKALDKEVLGSQSYQFRVLKAAYNAETGKYEATDELFIPKGARYTVAGTNQTGIVGEGGYFTLTPGQGVTFNDVLNSSDGATHYVVEETITQEVDSQFTIESPNCSVNGVSKDVTELGNTEPGRHVYRTEALELAVEEDNALARNEKTQLVGFTNLVDEAKLSTLRITKKIKTGSDVDPNGSFDMRVTIGDTPLSVGTTYDIVDANTGTMISQAVEVTKKGYVTIKDGQTAVISGILSTSTFNVTEDAYDCTATYSSQDDGVVCTNAGASGVMPLAQTIDILVVNSDSSGLTVDKTVAAGEKSDEFMLTLEAFSTGMTSSLSSTRPADIVLVLDQSASMYTPKGADADRYDRWYSQNSNSNLQRLSTDQLDKEKGSHLGYYVAQTKEKNRVVNEGKNDYNGNGSTGEALNVYDWFIVQYVDGTGWVYVRVGDTTTSVNVDTANKVAYDSASGSQYNKTLVSNEGSGKLITSFNYYQSQYGSLYESVNDFVSDLATSGAETGVEHRIAITGFSSPYYDGVKNYEGSGLYIDGTYYLYDADYKYMGYANSNSTHGYTLYAPDEIYESMRSILPAAREGDIWSSTVPAGATLIPLDPNKAVSTGDGTYFAPVPATDLPMYPALTTEQYASALMPVHSLNGEGQVTVSEGVIDTIEAIRTNFQQTCPAAGLDMAQKIFQNNPSVDRDKIVILFTDGVPTVSLSADREYGISYDASVTETYWSGMSGAKDAANLANDLKGLGIQIYTIGTSGLTANVPVNPDNNRDGAAVSSITGEMFLEYVSSNYQGISSIHTVKTKGYNTPNNDSDDDNQTLAVSKLTFYQNGAEITASAPAAATADIYSKTSADGDFSVAFRDIMQSVSSPNVTLGAEAVLKETLSDYFDLNTVDPSGIEVLVAPYTGTDENGTHTFGNAVSAKDQGFDIKVSFADSEDRENVIVNVSGFSYSEHYVRQDPATGNMLGYKLLVKVPIKARDGFWGGNNVPTNKYTTAIYDGDGNEVQPFPMPEANVPVEPVLVAMDKTVYYGGDVNAAELLEGITIDGVAVNVGEHGELTPGQSWMDDFATLTWNSGSTVPGSSIISGRDAEVYPYAVTLAPIYSGTENRSDNPSNMAGSVVSNAVASDVANVYVLEPVIEWRDMTIKLGTAVDDVFYVDHDFVSLHWVDQDTGELPDALPDNPPTLSYTYSYEGKPLEDVPVDVAVRSSYGDEDITHVTTFTWEKCTQSIHLIKRDQIFRHNGSDVSYEFYIHVEGGDVLVSNKKAETVDGITDHFDLVMEGYVTGSIEQITITKPADIVLVLDHSASMHTPVGAPDILYSPKTAPDGTVLNPGFVYNGPGQLTKADLDPAKGTHRGYYVAQSTSSKWWFLMEYNASTSKWIGYSIPSTESIVDTVEGNYTEHTMTQRWSYSEIPSQLVFYKTQYGVLYESVHKFVNDLRSSGVEHSVAIVGFAGSETDGTRIYVGGDETTVKTKNALYHVNTSEARRTELFKKAMKNVQDADQFTQLLSNIEAIDTNASFTCPTAGLLLANELYKANELDRVERDRIMILFTDGIPNHANGEDNETYTTQDEKYDEIVKAAALCKTEYGTKIYSVSTTTMGAGANRTFLSYVSSDYPDAVDYAHPGERAEGTNFTAEVNGIDDMGIVFNTVTTAVSGTKVELDASAVLKDTLTNYFQLSGINPNVTVFTQKYLGNNQWGEEVPFADAVVNITSSVAGGRQDTIEVSGFDYSAEYISEEGRTQTVTNADGTTITVSDYRGSKLVVKVRIEARDGFWGGNNVPTNQNTAGIYGKGDELLSKFPEPQVNVPVKPVVTSKDQVVYYGQTGVDALDDLVDKITVDGKEVVYDKTTGTFTPVEEWMDDFSDMTWNPDSNLIDPSKEPTISGIKSDEYSFGVILTPKTDGTTNSIPENGGNIAGDPVTGTGVPSEPATGSVDILVPVITFEDSTIVLGDETNKEYYETINRQPTIGWVNQDDPTGANNLPTKPTEGFETEPELSFTYTPEGTGENIFTQDTPVNVEVHLGNTPSDDNKITGEVYFDWKHCDSDLHEHDEIIFHKGSETSNEFYIHVTYVLSDDTVVIDFGIPVDIDATYNDIVPSGVTIQGIKTGGDVQTPFTTTEETGFASEAISGHGKLVMQSDGKLRYIPTDMKMNVSEVFRYQICYQTTDKLGNIVTRYYQSTVTVIPATIIYYEDDFLNFSTEIKQEDGSYKIEEGGWSVVDTASDVLQGQDRPGIGDASIDANQIYGYDSNYANMAGHSYGVARKIKVRSGTAGVATFSFRGTGFDVISHSSDDTGVIMVTITDADTGEYITTYMVDTYYGYSIKYYKYTYTYTDTGWTQISVSIARDEMGTSDKIIENPVVGDSYVQYVTRLEPNTSASDSLYQVPVIKVNMEDVIKTKDNADTPDVDETEYYGYGHYEVEIYAAYGFLFDHGQCECNADEQCTGCYDLYLDAIRIYDPANDGADDVVVKDAYITDHEYKPIYEELRNHLISVGQFDALDEDDDISGVIFIDSNTVLDDNSASGVPGGINPSTGLSAIADYTNYGPNNELYLASGQAVAFTLADGAGIDRVHLALKSVGGSAQISVYGVDGTETVQVLENHTVNTATDLYYDISTLIGKTVVIRNSGGSGILSITNLKTTYLPDAASGTSVFSMNHSNAELVLSSINEGAPAPVDPEGEKLLVPQYATVSFEDEIKLNIYFEADETLSAESLGMITFTSNEENGTVENADKIYTQVSFDVQKNVYCISTDGIAAKNLADLIWFRLYARLDDGTVVYSKLLNYSPKIYADVVINSADYSSELKALAVSMLNYGAQAQLYFGYNTDVLMNAHLSAEERNVAYSTDLFKGVGKVDASKASAFAATANSFTRKYPTVSFNGAFNLSYYFATAYQPDDAPVLYYWTQSDYESAQQLSVENATGCLMMTGNTQFTATVPGIAPKDMNSTIYVAAVYTSNGENYCSGVLAYSLGAYFAAQAQQDGNAMQSLAKAAAVYGSCAENYFG